MGGATPGCFSIIHYPSELIDLIIFHVTSPSDLLHIALTCRALCRLIIPSHLEFREISCVPTSESVWKYLIKYPYQARMVRSLQLLGSLSAVKNQGPSLSGKWKESGPHVWPYSVPACAWRNDEGVQLDEEARNFVSEEILIHNGRATPVSLLEKRKTGWSALCCAVKQMTFLEAFTWTQETEIHEDMVSAFVSALRDSCPHMRKITTRHADRSWIGGRSSAYPISPRGLTLNHLSIWTHSPATLTRLTLSLRLQQTTIQTEILTSVLQLIGKSYPHLRFLFLRLLFVTWASPLQPEHFYVLLKNAHWPELQSLVFLGQMNDANFNVDSRRDICESFFLNHPRILLLDLPTSPPSIALLGERTNELLPNLKSLNYDGPLSQAFDISTSPHSSWRAGSDTPHHLVFLSCSISSRCIAVLARLPSLRYLVADFHEDGYDTFRAALEALGRMTKLERLDMGHSGLRPAPPKIDSLLLPKSSPPPLLPCLTHFMWRNFVNISMKFTALDLKCENVPVAFPITSFVTMMPNLKYLKVFGEWVRVLQLPGDTGETRISFEQVDKGEVEPSHAWTFMV